jgi:hypothetical protein
MTWGSFATDQVRLADLAMRSVPKRFESRVHRDDGIDQLNYIEESLVCAAQANGQTTARSTSAPPAAVLGVRIITKGAHKNTRAA